MQNAFAVGLCPKPHWGAYSAPPKPIIWWGDGSLPPHKERLPLLLAFSLEFRPFRPQECPLRQIPGYATHGSREQSKLLFYVYITFCILTLKNSFLKFSRNSLNFYIFGKLLLLTDIKVTLNLWPVDHKLNTLTTTLQANTIVINELMLLWLQCCYCLHDSVFFRLRVNDKYLFLFFWLLQMC